MGVKILWNYQLKNEVSQANFNTYKRIYNWQPFMKRVYGDIQIPITEGSEEGHQELHLQDPLQSSPNYGIDVYLRVHDLIRRLATCDS